MTELGPIPITTRIRTIIDLAGVLPAERLEVVVDPLVRDGRVRASALRERAEALRVRGRPGVAKVLALLDGGVGGPARPESWLERQVLRLLGRAGLPAPRSQVVLAGDGRRARVDFLYEEARLVVEADGHATHSTRRQRQADAEREAALVAAGWRVIRFTYEDVIERPRYVVDTVRLHLGRAA